MCAAKTLSKINASMLVNHSYKILFRVVYFIIKMNDILIAKQCLNFKGYYCDNNDCLNDSCPLHKSLK